MLDIDDVLGSGGRHRAGGWRAAGERGGGPG